MTIEKLNNSYNYSRLNRPDQQPSETERLKKACRDFEAIFMNQMLDAMRDTLTGTSVFGNSLGKDIYKSMYYRQLTSDIAHGGSSLGISDLLYNNLENKINGHRAASEIERAADDNIIGNIKE